MKRRTFLQVLAGAASAPAMPSFSLAAAELPTPIPVRKGPIDRGLVCQVRNSDTMFDVHDTFTFTGGRVIDRHGQREVQEVMVNGERRMLPVKVQAGDVVAVVI